jgi:hypothetical protein
LLSFAERQAIVQCLISKVVVTGAQVDIYYVLPFVSAPQECPSDPGIPEGTPGLFCRLRLEDRTVSAARPAHWPLRGGSGRRHSPHTRLVPQPADPHVRRLSMSGNTPYHYIRWNVTKCRAPNGIVQPGRFPCTAPGQPRRPAPAARGDHAPPGVHGRRQRLRRQSAPGPYPTPA